MRILSRAASQDLSLGALSASFNFGEACKLVTVYVHSSAPITEEITISYVSDNGASYDTVIERKTLEDMSDYVFAASGDLVVNEVESIKVQVTNANLVGTVYVTVKAEK